jgi:alkylhydroperoxidase/carboxymuconolactone decarboxylase family protein YurZ
LPGHIDRALNTGLSREEIGGLIADNTVYAGRPTADYSLIEA